MTWKRRGPADPPTTAGGGPAGSRPPRSRAPRGRYGGCLVLLVLLGLRRGADRDAQDRLRHVGRDPGRHLVEERARLVLVRDERVLLAVATEVDPLAELLHRREVLHPVRVDGPKQQPPLDRPRGLLP